MSATVASAARRLNSRSKKRGRRLPPLLLVTDEARLSDPCAAIMALPRGSGVVYRHYSSANRDRLAQTLASLCRARRLLFIVGGDAKLAMRVHADGLHLREADLCRAVPRFARRLLVTAAAHTRPALLRAYRLGADAALLGPVFATESHPGAPALGPLRFAALVRGAPLPVYGLGGIAAGNARRLLGSGAAGIAALGALAPKRRPGSRIGKQESGCR